MANEEMEKLAMMVDARARAETRCAELEAAESRADVLRNQLTSANEYIATQKQRLAAGTAAEARAELRARELAKALEEARDFLPQHHDLEDPDDLEAFGRLTKSLALLASDADSDARLREVVEKAVFRAISCGESRGAAGIFDDKSKENDAKFVVNEALGVKP